MNILIIYDSLPIEELANLRSKLEEKFKELSILVENINKIESFSEKNSFLNFVFFEQSIDSNKIESFFKNQKTRKIKGITMKDQEVLEFISSL